MGKPSVDLQRLVVDLTVQASDLTRLDEDRLRESMGRVLGVAAELVGFAKAEICLATDSAGVPPTAADYEQVPLHSKPFGSFGFSRLMSAYSECEPATRLTKLANAPAFVFHENQPVQMYDDPEWLDSLHRDHGRYFHAQGPQPYLEALQALAANRPEYSARVRSWVADVERDPSIFSSFYRSRKWCWETKCPLVADPNDFDDFSDFMSGTLFPVRRPYRGKQQVIGFVVMTKVRNLAPGQPNPSKEPLPPETIAEAQRIVDFLALPIQIVANAYALRRVTDLELRERERASRAEQTEVLAGQMAHEVRGEVSPLLMSLDAIGARLPTRDAFGAVEHALVGAFGSGETAQRAALREGAEFLKAFAPDGEVASRLASLRALGERLSRTVEGVMDYARLGKELAEESGPVDLVTLATQVAGEFPASRVSVQVGPAIPTVPGHRDRLHQVLRNLIRNAVEAVDEAAQTGRPLAPVQLSVAEQDGKFLIQVKDEGVGLTPEQRARLFTPMFTTKPTSGHGLGLATAQRIVQSHGGEILVETTPGLGSTFTVVIPAQRKD